MTPNDDLESWTKAFLVVCLALLSEEDEWTPEEDVREVDVYDAVRETRAKMFLASLSEDELDYCKAALGTLDDEDNRDAFWHWVKRIQEITKISKDEAREVLNYMIDDLYE